MCKLDYKGNNSVEYHEIARKYFNVQILHDSKMPKAGLTDDIVDHNRTI